MSIFVIDDKSMDGLWDGINQLELYFSQLAFIFFFYGVQEMSYNSDEKE